MAPLPRTVLLPVGALAAALLAACGSTSPSSGAPTSVPTAGGATSPGSPGSSLAAALTVTRTGGVAGVRDRLLIGTDGIASVSRHGEPTGRCRVQAALMGRIAGAARSVDWASLPTAVTTPRHPDDLVVVVSSGRAGARLEDPAVKDLAQPLTDLLNDATSPVARRRLCQPV